MYNDSHNILYSSIIPMASIILGFFGIFKAGAALPRGQRRADVMFFFSFCTISFLLFQMQTLPLNGQTLDMLRRLTFFCFISIPLIFSMAIVKKSDSGEYIDWFTAISIIILLLFSVLFAPQNTLLILAIDIPILAVCIFHSYQAFRESITPRKQADNFRRLCIQILLGITPPIAFLMSFDWQEASLLIFIIPLWAMFETWNIHSGKHNEDFNLEIAAHYAAPLILLTLLLLIFRGATDLSDNLKDIDFTCRIRLTLAGITALTGTLLFNPLKEQLKNIINIISRRYMDDFSSTLYEIQQQKKTFDQEEIQKHLANFFPGIDSAILFRLPFKKVFKVSNISGSLLFDINDSLFIDGKMLQDFEKDGYSILTPSNIENYNLKFTFMEKTLSMVEKSDMLLIPIFEPSDAFPCIIITFIQNEKSSFQTNLIRNLFSWVKVIKSSAISLWKRLSPEKIELSDELMETFATDELALATENLLSTQIPLRKFNIILMNENKEDFRIFPANSEITAGIIAAATRTADSKFIQDSQDERQTVSEKDRKYHMGIDAGCIILKIPSVADARRFIYLEFDEEMFHFSPSAQKAFDDFALRMGLILDKLSISEELEEHKELVDLLEKKVDTQLLKVAEDLHDTVAQEMFAAKMLVEMLEKQLRGTSPHTEEDIKILRSAVNEGLRKTRAMIVKLRDVDQVKAENFIDELKNFSLKVESETGMRITFENINIVDGLSDNTVGEISMIIREGINNARKHSGASCLKVLFSNKGDEISLEIHDNGRGFITDNTMRKDGFGIPGMKSRCSRLGGKLNIVSSPGKGTVINVTFNRNYRDLIA